MVLKVTRILIYVLAISVLFSACKTSRHAQRKVRRAQIEMEKPSGETEEALPSPVQTDPQTPTITPSPSQPYSYQWVSYRGTANIEFDGKKYQCNYYVVNRVDSIIYLNINLMGIELARMVATPDELIFVNKMSNEYYRGDYSFVEKYLKSKADFFTLQAITNGEEAALRPYKDITFSYHPVIDETSNRSFFDSLSVSMNGGQRKVDAQLKNLKFNTPGPTGIKIPEGFKEMKL